MTFRSLSLVAGLVAVACVFGCRQSTPETAPAVLAQRQALLLTAEPSGTIGVLDARKKLDPHSKEGKSDGENTSGEDGQESDDAHEHEEAELAIEGKIGEMEKGKAAFVLNDVSASHSHGDEHGHSHDDDGDGHDNSKHKHDHASHDHSEHDHENCPFCKEAAEGKEHAAIVQFFDKDGKLLSMDVAELFGVKEHQTVVVRGKARVDEAGMLFVHAVGLYVKK